MPRIAVFPKACLDDLCVTGTMSTDEWIAQAATLGVDGLELYSGIADLQTPESWTRARERAAEVGLSIPMLCCSPDFTHPDPAYRAEQIRLECRWIDMTAGLGGQFCRILSGQRRPELADHEGVSLAADCIRRCAAYAATQGVTLVLENHFKDNYWTFPEFAQRADVFCALVDAIDPAEVPNFGVNFDPSNALVANDDPLRLLERVGPRVKTMHASDRYVVAHQPARTAASASSVKDVSPYLRHGEVGRGLNDYDAIFAKLRDLGFDGWISIEDGVDGFDQLERSVSFVRRGITKYWPTPRPI